MSAARFSPISFRRHSPAGVLLTLAILLTILALGGCSVMNRMKASRAPAQPMAAAPQDAGPADRTEPVTTGPAAPADSAPPADGRTARRQREIDELVAQALNSPQLSQRAIAALQASDKAVAGLADTLAAIGAAQKVVADNLRNADTIGYKAVRLIHGDPSQPDPRQVNTQLDMEQGSAESTSRALDVAIQGEGFFQVQVAGARGGIGYTRFGNWFVNSKGELVAGVGDSYRVLPPITIPAGATDVTISQDGVITVSRAGQPVKTNVGRLMLTQFPNPSNLKQLGAAGSCILVETPASGTPVEGPAGENGTGQVLQGYLEQSNVDLTRERLRLRFLQNWREAILRAIDGDAAPREGARIGTAGVGGE